MTKKVFFLFASILFAQFSFAQTLQTVTTNGNITNNSIELAMQGSTTDPYGYISVTMPADGNSYSYYGLTREGNLGMGMGITASNQFFIGGATDGATHILNGYWLTMNGANAQFSGNITATQFNGLGAGLTGMANSLSIGGNAYSATVPQENYWDLVGTGGVNDPYGTMSVSNPADANNHSYYSMTRNGQIPYGIGINTSNNFIIGVPTPGNNGSITNPLFTINNNGAAWFNASVSAAKFITSGGSASQFIKGDGSLDGTIYLPYSNISGTVNYVPVFNTGNSLVNSNTIYISSENIGIGTTSPQSKLAVNGTITATQVKVTQTGWSDFVFDSGYHLDPLSKTAAFIKTNHHLPGIPSAKEIETNGLDLGGMEKKQMQKIEELTLYVIKLQKEVEELKATISQIGKNGTTVNSTKK